VSSTQRKGPSGMDSTLVLDLTSSRFGARTTATPDDQVFDATELVEVLDESPPPVRARKRFVLRPPICPPARASMVKR
nr:hypothetical protein [Deltaproteobacteria bacterium]